MGENTVEFVGGPWDGDIKSVENLEPIEVLKPNNDPSKGPPAILAGRYLHGRDGKRGKMLWQPRSPTDSAVTPPPTGETEP